MRVLLVSLECEGKVVSGNGTYAASVRRAVMAAGNKVMVICGRPKDDEESGHEEEGVAWSPVSRWGRLDRESAWEEFASVSAALHAERVAAFSPEAAISVDWTGSEALAAVMERLPDSARDKVAVVHMNFRTYWLSDGLAAGGEDAAFYRAKEEEAMRRARVSVALNREDAKAMEGLVEGSPGLPKGLAAGVRVLSPPLRRDIASRARSAGAGDWRGGEGRDLILYVGRVTEVKNVRAFVDACAASHAELASAGCAPALVGHAADDDEYAQECIGRHRALPGSYLSGFVGAEELAELLRRTRVMCHPAAYEAWGMTVAEAAAFGVPAIVHSGPGAQVGVCELLPVGDCSIGVDFSGDAESTGRAIAEIVRDASMLERVSGRARERSLGWDEDAHARALGGLLEEAAASHPS